MSETIWTPKRSCPRDLGLFQCADCRQKTTELSAMGDYPVDPVYCGREFDGNICGQTHLGYAWCEECRQSGRDSRNEPCSHAGTYEMVSEWMGETEVTVEEFGPSPTHNSDLLRTLHEDNAHREWLINQIYTIFGVSKEQLLLPNEKRESTASIINEMFCSGRAIIEPIFDPTTGRIIEVSVVSIKENEAEQGDSSI